jgi:hypothetical protein
VGGNGFDHCLWHFTARMQLIIHCTSTPHIVCLDKTTFSVPYTGFGVLLPSRCGH